MRVCVVGAHGQVGQRICRLLAERGDDVLGMVRKTEQKDRISELGATPMRADLEVDTVFDVSGCDAIVFSAGAGAGSGPARKETVDYGGAVKLIDAAVEAGIDRFVMVSARRVDEPDSAPEALRPYLMAKARADAYLGATNLAYSIVRPGRLTDDAPTGRVNVYVDDTVSRGEITRQDTAAVVAEVLRAPNTSRKTFGVTGGDVPIPEAVAKL